MRRTKLALLVTAIGLTIAVGVARAGSKGWVELAVTPGSMIMGDLGYARNSADTSIYAGCYVFKSGGGATTGSCYVRDASGAYGTCSTTDGALISIINSMKSDGRFVVYFSAGTCTSVYYYNASSLQPKAL